MIFRWTCMLFCVAILAGCSRDNHITEYRVAKQQETSPDASAEPTEEAVGLHWSLPEGWNEVPNTSSMRLASFVVEEIEGSDCSVSKFAGDAGGPVANVNRWRRQLGMAEGAPEDVLADLQSGRSGVGPYQFTSLVNEDHADQAFLVAILPFGESTVFVKLSVPPASIESVQPAFLSFCNSFHAAGPGHSH
jgi:hypothetical protein